MTSTELVDLRSTLPTASQLLVHVVDALKKGEGSATNAEISAYVVDTLGLSEAQQQVMRGDGRRPQIEQALSEAKSHLKAAGLLDQSTRDVWGLTEAGESANQKTIESAQRVADALRRKRRAKRPADANGETDGPSETHDGATAERDWKEVLVERLLALSPGAFERLAQRILREAGFENVRVRGRSGDGGIDGEGVYRPSILIGFQVYWQSKRYRGAVPAKEVRDFRGAMVGRGDKGLFITTGTFTASAREEASREGAPPIDLIDGDALASLLADLGLGVDVTERVEKDYHVKLGWFDALDEVR